MCECKIKKTECETCKGSGMVGAYLTADVCPDCETPPAPEQVKQPGTIPVSREDAETIAAFFEHENPHHLVAKAMRVGMKFRALLEGK